MKKYEFELWGSKYNFSTSKPIVVVDLDGTLSDGTHRLHLLPTEDLHLTESWSEFNKAAVGDSPIKSTVAVVNGLWMSGFAIVILTGRSDEVMADTCDWLNYNGIKYDALIMRRKEDNRKDTVIKEEVLRAIGLENIVCAFDDSQNVVKHFRSLGITTYQVTEYDKPHAHIQSHGVEELQQIILNVAYANPRGRNIFGFKVGAMINARINEKGVLVVKSPKTGVDMHIKENGGRLFIRSMSGQTLATFTK